MSGRSSTNRHSDHVRRKDSFEAGEITTLGAMTYTAHPNAKRAEQLLSEHRRRTVGIAP